MSAIIRHIRRRSPHLSMTTRIRTADCRGHELMHDPTSLASAIGTLHGSAREGALRMPSRAKLAEPSQAKVLLLQPYCR